MGDIFASKGAIWGYGPVASFDEMPIEGANLPPWFNRAVNVHDNRGGKVPHEPKAIIAYVGEVWNVPKEQWVQIIVSEEEFAEIRKAIPWEDWAAWGGNDLQDHSWQCQDFETHLSHCKQRDWIGRAKEALEKFKPDKRPMFEIFPFVSKAEFLNGRYRVRYADPARRQYHTDAYWNWHHGEWRVISQIEFDELVYLCASVAFFIRLDMRSQPEKWKPGITQKVMEAFQSGKYIGASYWVHPREETITIETSEIVQRAFAHLTGHPEGGEENCSYCYSWQGPRLNKKDLFLQTEKIKVAEGEYVSFPVIRRHFSQNVVKGWVDLGNRFPVRFEDAWVLDRP